jgi:hypothetical protein
MTATEERIELFVIDPNGVMTRPNPRARVSTTGAEGCSQQNCVSRARRPADGIGSFTAPRWSAQLAEERIELFVIDPNGVMRLGERARRDVGRELLEG